MTKNVIFDLDGTILDTLPDLATAANYALEKLGFPVQSEAQVRDAIGHGIRNLLKDLMKCDDIETLEKCRGIFKNFYDEHKADSTKPYDGIPQMLVDLKKCGYRLYVISNKYDGAARELVSRYFGEIFDGVYGSRDDIAPKPSDEIFRLLCAERALRSGDTVYVGDSEVDCAFAQNCGLKFIGVTWGFRSRDILLESGAKILVDSSAELYDKILDIDRAAR